MKTRDANTTEENMKLFNFADHDSNGEISEAELARYNGPLLVENFPEKTARIIGHAGGLPMSGLIITDNEVDYYPGLQIEQVDKAGRVVFNQIDTDHNSVISTEEMESVADAKQKIDEAEKKLNKIQTTRTALTPTGALGAVVSLFLSNVYVESGGIIDYFKKITNNHCPDVTEARIFGGLALLSGGLMIVNRLVAKHKAQKVLNEVQDINHPYTEQRKEELKEIV